jgi:hypothetical protein
MPEFVCQIASAIRIVPAVLIGLLAMVVVALPCITSTARAEPAKPAGNARLLTPLVVADRGMGDMPAYSLLVPKGFKADVGVKWDPGSRYSYANFAGRVVDPSHGAELHFHPMLPFEFLQMAGAPQQQHGARAANGNICMPIPQDAKAMATDVLIPMLRPNVRDAVFVTHQDFPKVAALIQEKLQPLIDQNKQRDDQIRQMGGNPGETSLRAFYQRIRVKYVLDGVAMEEDFYFAMTVNATFNPPNQMNGLPGHALYFWILGELRSIRAPAGKLDAATPALVSVSISVRRLPQYAAVMSKLESDLLQQDLRHAMRMSEIHRKNAAELEKINRDTYRQEQQSNDRQRGQFIDSIQGIDRWTANDGTSYALPQEHSVVWRNSNGDIYVTNDPNINPGVTVDPALNWQRLERQP